MEFIYVPSQPSPGEIRNKFSGGVTPRWAPNNQLEMVSEIITPINRPENQWDSLGLFSSLFPGVTFHPITCFSRAQTLVNPVKPTIYLNYFRPFIRGPQNSPHGQKLVGIRGLPCGAKLNIPSFETPHQLRTQS